jgi:biopolymer transport protein ExbD
MMPRRFLVILCLLAASGVACGAQPPPDAQPPPIPSANFAAELKQVKLPSSTYLKERGESSATVLVNNKYLLIDGDTHPVAELSGGLKAIAQGGFDERLKRSGPDGMLISPLEHGLQWARAQGGAPDKASLEVIADRATPYRVLFEVVYTATQAGFSNIALAAQAKASRTSIPIVVPQSDVLDGDAITVLVAPDGFTVKTPVGNLATGCELIGEGLTLPRTAAGYDFTGLTTCAERVKSQGTKLAESPRVTLTASPEIALQTIISAMDALRGTGRELFPEVALGFTR